MEWSFFVTEDALKRLQPNVQRDEAGLLDAFDANRASSTRRRRRYTRDRKGSYELAATDF